MNKVTNERKEFSYDADNRLARFVSKVGDTIDVTQTNAYNGKGQRIKRTEADEVTKYFYDRESVLYTTDNEGDITVLNLIGLEDNIIESAREYTDGDEDYFFYNKDVRSSVTNLLSPGAGQVVNKVGATTGNTNGKIISTNFSATSGGVTFKNLTSAGYSAAGGIVVELFIWLRIGELWVFIKEDRMVTLSMLKQGKLTMHLQSADIKGVV